MISELCLPENRVWGFDFENQNCIRASRSLSSTALWASEYQCDGIASVSTVQRQYVSGYARFLTVDRGPAAMGDPGTWNRYAYVGGDPINRNDPRGLCYVDQSGNEVSDYQVSDDGDAYNYPGYYAGGCGQSNPTYDYLDGGPGPTLFSTTVVDSGYDFSPSSDPCFMAENSGGCGGSGGGNSSDETSTVGGGAGSSSSLDFGKTVASCAADELGVTDTLAFLGWAAGQPLLPAPGKFAGATAGTSVISSVLSSVGWKLPIRIWAPTAGAITAASANVGRVVGRWIPIVDGAVLAWDAVKIAACTIENSGIPALQPPPSTASPVAVTPPPLRR
jgi:RHS repeat-associated protein